MTDLTMPGSGDGPRVAPRTPEEAPALVKAEYDKAKWTWGMPNYLVWTMGCHPRLAMTEVDYANSFIFEESTYMKVPRPGGGGEGEEVLFPSAGFIDPITKELVISLVSLLNRSRYSITHHTMIGFSTLSRLAPGASAEDRAAVAEALLLNLVDSDGQPAFEGATRDGAPLYSDLQLALLRIGAKMNDDAHKVTDAEMAEARRLCAESAREAIGAGPLAGQFPGGQPDDAYIASYVDAMIVEITWCMAHFGGLLNRWFTVMKMHDETFDLDGPNSSFVDAYNATIPESIKNRNNSLLAPDGWGGIA